MLCFLGNKSTKFIKCTTFAYLILYLNIFKFIHHHHLHLHVDTGSYCLLEKLSSTIILLNSSYVFAPIAIIVSSDISSLINLFLSFLVLSRMFSIIFPFSITFMGSLFPFTFYRTSMFVCPSKFALLVLHCLNIYISKQGFLLSYNKQSFP